MMHSLTAHQRTLGELRGALAIRLGFPTQGGAAQAPRVLLDAWLSDAHAVVHAQLDDALRRKTAFMTTSPGEIRYDWHDHNQDEAIDASRVHAVGIETEAGYRPLAQGIDDTPRATLTPRQTPRRYDLFDGQLWLWPVPDARYTVDITYTAPMPRFTQDADRPGVPDRLIFLYALATAKAHYREPDAGMAGKAFEALLAQHQRRQHGERRYFARSTETQAPMPHVVRAQSGYVLCRGS